MEQFLETHSEVLVPGLVYEAGSKASSITERREITVHPSGASSYSPTGGKTFRFVISDMSGYIILNSIRLQCQVKAGTASFKPQGADASSKSGLLTKNGKLRDYKCGGMLSNHGHTDVTYTYIY